MGPGARRSIAAAVLLWAASSAAQPRREARLEYTRGPGADHCPAEDAIRSAVSARLGYEPFRADAPTTVSASITRSGRVLRADVELRDAAGKVAGTRQLTSKQNDCSELVAAMTLAISIAIDPQSQTRPAPPAEPAHGGPDGAPAPPSNGTAPPPPGPARPPSLPPPIPPPAAARGRASARLLPREIPERVVGRLGAGALVGVATAPSPTVGFVAAPGVGWRSVSLDLEGRVDLRASTKAEQGPGSVSSQLLTVSLVPCWHRGALEACALAAIGAVRGKGEGVDKAQRDATLFAAVGARAGAEAPLADHLAGFVHADLSVIATPTTLELNGHAEWKTPPVAGAVAFGLLTSF